MRRPLVFAGVGLGSVFLLALLLLGFLLATRGGARWCLNRLGGEALMVERIEGKVLGPLTLHGLTFRTPAFVIEVDRVRLTWAPTRLLGGLVDVRSIDTRGVRITTLGGSREEPTRLRDRTLPLALRIGPSTLRDLRFVGPLEEEGLRVAEVHMAGSSRGGEWALDSLVAVGIQRGASTIQLFIHGALTSSGDYPLSGRIDWSGDMEREEGQSPLPLAGALQITGSLARMEVVHDLTAPLYVGLTGSVRDALSGMDWDAEVSVPSFLLSELRTDAAPHAVEGHLIVTGGAENLQASGSLRLTVDGGGEYRGEILFSRDGISWDLDSLGIRAESGAGHILVSGRAEMQGTGTIGEMDVHWQDLSWPLPGSASPDVTGFLSREGQVNLKGGLDSLQLHLSAEFASGESMLGSWELNGTGRLSKRVSELRASFLGRVEGIPEIAGEVSGALAGSRIDLTSLTLDLAGTEDHLEIQGWADTGGGSPRVDARASWRDLGWPPQGNSRIRSPQGTLTVEGHPEQFVMGVDAMVSGESLPPSRWTIQGSGGISSDTLRANALFSGNLDGGGQLDGAVRLNRSPGRIDLDTLHFSEMASGARFSGKGAWAVGATDSAGWLTGSWEDVSWPLGGVPEFQSPSGALRWDGSLDSFRVGLDFEVGGNSLPEGRWTAQGAGGRDVVRFDEVRGHTLNGDLLGRITLGFGSALSWDLAMAGEALDPGVLNSDWPGTLDLDLRSGGAFVEGELQGALEVPELRGELRGRSFSAALGLSGDREAFRIDTLSLRSGSVELDGGGGVSDRWDIRWRLDAPSLADLLPGLEGSGLAQGTMTGPRNEPRVQLSVAGEGFAAKDRRMAAYSAEMNVDLSDHSPSWVEGRIEGFSTSGLAVDSVTLSGTGLASDHSLLLRARGGEEGLTARLQGIWSESEWAGELETLDLVSTTAGPWSLEAPSQLRVARDSSRVGPTCWASSSGHLCFSAGWDREAGASWDISGEGLPLSFLQPVLPQGVELTGTAELSSSGSSDPLGRVTASALVVGSGGTIRYRLDSHEWEGQDYEGFRLVGAAEEGAVRGEGTLTLADRGELFGTLEGRPGSGGEQVLSGALTGEISDNGLLGALADDLSETNGRLSMDLSVSGSRTFPTLSGSIEVLDGGAFVVPLGIRLQSLGFRARGDTGVEWRAEGEVTSGSGQIRLTGNASLPNPQRPWSGAANLTGTDFELFNTELGRLDLSPQMELTASPGAWELEGTVRVPRAQFIARHLELAVPPSSDVVVLGRETSTEESGTLPPTQARARIRVDLGEDVRIDALGLQGRLSGGLLVSSDPGRPLVGSGELLLEDGTYSAYRQAFEIEQGRLIFANSPLDDPGLDLRVVRRFPEMTAGMTIAGTARGPRISLFSDRSQTDDEILSYLLLGRPLSGLGQTEGSLVHSVAKTLGLAGGQFLVARIGTMFGVEEARIEGGADPSKTSLVLGKMLLPRVKVDYAIGLLGAPNTLRIHYEIGKGWVLQTESGSEAGADLIYSFKETRKPGSGR